MNFGHPGAALQEPRQRTSIDEAIELIEHRLRSFERASAVMARYEELGSAFCTRQIGLLGGEIDNYQILLYAGTAQCPVAGVVVSRNDVPGFCGLAWIESVYGEWHPFFEGRRGIDQTRYLLDSSLKQLTDKIVEKF